MKNSHIIILDDRTDKIEKMKEDIVSLDYQNINIFDNIQDIKEHIKKSFVNLIFVPIDNNLQNIRIIEKLLKISDIPIIYITQNTTKELKQKTEHTNPVGYLEISYNTKHLNSMIKLALSRYIPHLP